MRTRLRTRPRTRPRTRIGTVIGRCRPPAVLTVVMLLCAVAACAGSTERATTGQQAGHSTWHEVFRDDFTGPAGSPLSAADWRHDEGYCYPGCPAANWGTGEIGRHTDSTANSSLDGAGHLAITPLRAPDGTWTSARIETQRSDFAVPPGGTLRIEASIKLPEVDTVTGKGYWPAFWAMGEPIRGNGYQGWPQWGEVDVMEQINGRPEVYSALHSGVPGRNQSHQSPPFSCPTCSSGFHVYAAEIDAHEVRYYVDGVLHHRVTEDELGAQAWRDATQHGMFLILNVAMGGNWPAQLGGGPDTGTVPGRPMLVDHVSVSTR
ncbi:family 16 glycosylhydrolase [Streptomyces sp. N35]|uniref:family 16 glycosylhydrolase n=1 Tax=Streptomyces sp. N35 TaxID=2795730 RepID=UPI0018F31E54|nr:family 16 glycosylhydrolase [Streptomyces sp. N35]